MVTPKANRTQGAILRVFWKLEIPGEHFVTSGENSEETMTTGPRDGFVKADNSLYANSLQTYKIL